MRRFRMFTHIYAASFTMKTCFNESSNVFLSQALEAFSKRLAFSESSIKLKVRSNGTLFVILLTSPVVCKQRLLDGNEIVQYLQNC